ncbi:hypothetical protein MBH78_07630 [Oceanimonas sp. NS1]|nr:hypothetical protein [Oceanimonas sp. NS1]
MIATPQDALDAAAHLARSKGLAPLVLGDCIEGESREVAKVHAAIAKQILKCGQPVQAPCVILSGGETTVTIKGNGRGGRNSEFMLSLFNELKGQAGVYALAADTDGIDGVEDNAGAMITPELFARAEAAGLKAEDYLANNDSYGFSPSWKPWWKPARPAPTSMTSVPFWCCRSKPRIQITTIF